MTDPAPAATSVPLMPPAGPGGAVVPALVAPPAASATPAAVVAPAPANAPAPAPAAPAAGAAPAAPAAAAPVAAKPGFTTLLEEAAPAPAAADPAAPPAAAPAPLADYKIAPIENGILTVSELDGLTKIARGLSLPADKAQAFAVQQNELRVAEVKATADLWAAQARAHPTIGGANLPQTMVNVKAALSATTLTPEQRQAVAKSAFANNPTFLQILNDLARFIPREDVIHRGSVVPVATAPKNQTEAAKALGYS